MLPKNRIPTHPGEILLYEFLEPMGITQLELATRIETSTQRINEIVRGKRGITPETAWLFSQAFKTTPEFWMNLQANYDLARGKPATVVRAFVPKKGVAIKMSSNPKPRDPSSAPPTPSTSSRRRRDTASN